MSRSVLLPKLRRGRGRGDGSALALALAVALGPLGVAHALPHGSIASAPGVAVVAEGPAERWTVELGGVLVAALSAESNASTAEGDGLLLLVRPPRQPEGPRRLLRLLLSPEPRLEPVATDLGGWIDTLLAVELEPGGGLELVAAGRGRAAALASWKSLSPGPAADATRMRDERLLFEAPGFDPRGLAPGRLRRGVERGFVAVEPGRMRFWSATGERLSEARLPLAVARTANGFRLTSPPVAAMRSAQGLRYLAGPESVGEMRLRCYELAAGPERSATPAPSAQPTELWAALPGPEKVIQSWPFEIDGVPVLVVRTQAADELNLFERQRLRVLPLSADRTRAGSLPTLAVELDSKRWHETAIALGDVDGDGREDLLAAFPEGLSGTDLVAEWWRGEGGGRFESRVHRSDVPRAGGSWRLVDGAAPGILWVGSERLELRPFAAEGKNALAERPALAASLPVLPSLPAPSGQGASAPADDAAAEDVGVETEPLGAVELDRRPGAEYLFVRATGTGAEQLLLLRARPAD